jgi:predicted signal transduction protein with EAL and GGDEF domain
VASAARCAAGGIRACAEDSGPIVPIGKWALRSAGSDAARLLPNRIAVNLSAVQFRSRHVVETVFARLAATWLCPERLELEHRSGAAGEQRADLGNWASASRSMTSAPATLAWLLALVSPRQDQDRWLLRRDLSKAEPEAAAMLRALAGPGSSLGMTATAGAEAGRKDPPSGLTEMQGFVFSHPDRYETSPSCFLDEAERPATVT